MRPRADTGRWIQQEIPMNESSLRPVAIMILFPALVLLALVVAVAAS